MLLTLPSELLVEVLGFLDPATFAHCLRVCKSIRQHALSSTALLHRQLGKVPGMTDRLAGKSAPELLALFHRRALRHLLHGVDALADVSRFTLPTSERLRYGDLMICSCRTDHLLLTAVRADDASIGVFSIRSRFPILKCVLSPRGLDLGPEEDVGFEVVKVAFYDPHERSATCQCVDRLAVLYRYRLLGDEEGPFVREAVRQSKEILKLVTWKFTDAFDAYIEEIRDINTGGTLEPSALAVANDGSAVISYTFGSKSCTQSAGHRWQVEWVQRHLNKFYDPFPRVQVHTTTCTNNDAPAPTGIQIINRRVWFYVPGIPTPKWDMDDYSHTSSIHTCSSIVSMTSNSFTHSSFGLPLAVHHKHGLIDPAGEDYCLNSVLQLHFQTDGPRPGAYIIKGVHFPDGCQLFNPLLRYPNIEQFIVAELGGFNVATATSSSLGTILAVSPRHRRIAVATWNRVQIWAFHPNAFFERQKHSNPRRPSTATATDSNSNSNASTISSSADGSSADSMDTTTTNSTPSSSSNPTDTDGMEWPWVERCGWDYYSCFPLSRLPGSDASIPLVHENGIVALQPVELPSQGVVFALKFNGEDSLWAWTDRGPVKWQFGAGIDGRTMVYGLDCEIKEQAGV